MEKDLKMTNCHTGYTRKMGNFHLLRRKPHHTTTCRTLSARVAMPSQTTRTCHRGLRRETPMTRLNSQHLTNISLRAYSSEQGLTVHGTKAHQHEPPPVSWNSGFIRGRHLISDEQGPPSQPRGIILSGPRGPFGLRFQATLSKLFHRQTGKVHQIHGTQTNTASAIKHQSTN